MVSRDARADRPPRWLGLLCTGRAATTLIAMTYAACLPRLIVAWDMSATQAGLVQAAFNLGMGASLLAVSWLSDHVDPRRVLMVSAWAGAVLSLVFALGARSFESALVLYALVGLSQGGSYTPAIMVTAPRVASDRRGRAIGDLLASASLGYVGSLGLSGIALAWGSYQAAFLLCALGPLGGALLFQIALGRVGAAPDRPIPARATPRRGLGRRGRLLILAYMAHCWELLGLWAWVPAFVAASVIAVGLGDGAVIGAWTTGGLHLTGVVAALAAGRLSDRVGRRRTILLFAAAGAILSFTIGWLYGAPLWVLFALCVAYGFAALGDSPVLSTALTEALPDGGLGRAFGLRSVLGFLVGALAVVAFGAVIDATGHLGGAVPWGLAFSLLGLGGLAAVLFAARLKGDAP